MENAQTYTVGVWNAKPGMEQEFIKRWSEFANWVSEKINDTGTGRLLQDTENPSKFYSVATWENDQKVQEMRSFEEFKTFTSKIQEVVSDFTPPHIMDLSAQVGKRASTNE